MHAKIISLIIAGAMAFTGCTKTSEYITEDGLDYVMDWGVYRDVNDKVDTSSEEALLKSVDGNIHMVEGKIKKLDLKEDEYGKIHFILDTDGVDIPCKVRKDTIGIDIKNGTQIMGFGTMSDFSVELDDDISEFYCMWIEDKNGHFLNDEAVERLNNHRR